MHTGKIGQFFEVWVFHQTNVGFGVDGQVAAIIMFLRKNTFS
jgi:hypothetical protein